MQEMTHVVTLWLAWYRERPEAQEEAAGECPRRLLRLRMLHAPSREEAHREMQIWLERRGLCAHALERLEASPYGLQFQALKAVTV